jgi:ubiquinone/menaquinone biosynthesis C-methylase UbiE
LSRLLDESEETTMEAALRTRGVAEIYERTLVPSIFAPWAQEILERARPIGPADRVLDLGCGTGIVARLLRERLGGAARITGLDASADMIEMARALAPELEWREGNAMKLPFADASFELVVAQQMLQFVPEPAAALREIRRVLVPGGRFVAATWRPRHELPLYEVLGQVAERHLGVAHEKRFLLGDDAALRAMLAEAGFSDVRVDVVTRIDRFREFPYRLSALAANFDLSTLSEAEREARLSALEAESREAAQRFISDGVIAAPSRANLIAASAK